MFVTLTTTPTIEGRRIVEYKGIVFGEVISGVDFVKDFAAGLTNFFGGRSNSYEGELQKAREQALAELQQRASAMGANAVVGVDLDYRDPRRQWQHADGHRQRHRCPRGITTLPQ